MSESQQLRYTAILCNYNHGHYLPETIAALLNQTIPFDELVLIDDASTDDSVAIMRRLIADVPYARILCNPQNLGVVATANRGLAEAQGDIIFFVSADDWYSPHIVEWAKQAVALDSQIGMIAGNGRVRYIETGEERLFMLPFPQKIAVYQPGDLDAVARRHRVQFYGGANLFRKQALLDAGGMIASLKWSADWFLYFVLALRHNFAIIPHEPACFRVSAQQYSAKAQQWEFQGPVIAALITLLQTPEYADIYPFFRRHALLPNYHFRALGLFLTTPEFRSFITPLLLWKLTMYQPLRFLALNLIPRRFFEMLRHRIKI